MDKRLQFFFTFTPVIHLNTNKKLVETMPDAAGWIVAQKCFQELYVQIISVIKNALFQCSKVRVM